MHKAEDTIMTAVQTELYGSEGEKSLMRERRKLHTCAHCADDGVEASATFELHSRYGVTWLCAGHFTHVRRLLVAFD